MDTTFKDGFEKLARVIRIGSNDKMPYGHLSERSRKKLPLSYAGITGTGAMLGHHFKGGRKGALIGSAIGLGASALNHAYLNRGLKAQKKFKSPEEVKKRTLKSLDAILQDIRSRKKAQVFQKSASRRKGIVFSDTFKPYAKEMSQSDRGKYLKISLKSGLKSKKIKVGEYND